ncbi:hypothetical protein [Planctopirus ephydatiae]|uniref:hypothetical protein n=1 Tax=Planctopirus ephydatiae TaxID=2528019 RepID=UPI00119DCA30|nr:hypothetical protein [Planctopirus ephydatiae]
MEADFWLGVRIKVHKQVLSNLYELNLEGHARGRIDLKTGNFQLQTEQVSWKEEYPKQYVSMAPIGAKLEPIPLTPADRNTMQMIVQRVLGGDASQIPWSGQISGTIDLKNFGGGQGRIEMNTPFKGTWELPAGHSYSIEWPESLPKLGVGTPQWRVYPSEDIAHRNFLSRSRYHGNPRPLPDLGDEAAISLGNRVALVRFGRWHMELMGGVPNNPAQIQVVLESLQKLIEDQNLEMRFPLQTPK